MDKLDDAVFENAYSVDLEWERIMEALRELSSVLNKRKEAENVLDRREEA